MALPASPQPRLGRRTPDGWVVGRLRGVPVLLAPSWLLIAALLGIVAAPTFARVLPDAGALAIGLIAAVVPVMLLLSVLAHELCHGLAGHAVGAPPQRYVLTLWGGHTQFHHAMHTPGAAAAVALAGPAANVVLAALAWLGLQLIPEPRGAPVVFLLLQIAMISNAVVAGFNLLPGLPMDGGQALEALVWRLTGDRHRGMLAAGWGGRIVVILLVVATLGVPIAQGNQPRLFTVVWVVLLSAFLWSAASRSIARVHARRKVADLDLRTLAAPALALPAEASLDAAPSGRDHVVLLNSAGEPVMIVDPDARAAVPPQARATTPLGAVAVAIPTEAVITELHGADGVAAAAHAARFTPTIVLREHGRIIGVLSVNRLEQALAGRSRSRGRGAGPRA